MSSLITFYEESWDSELVKRADAIAQQSADYSTKTGAIVVSAYDQKVIATGFNRMPRGRAWVLSLDERLTRPEKYLWTVHSEIVALGKCAKRGFITFGAALYSNWWPCAYCSHSIIEAGIARVIGVRPDMLHPKYGHEFEVSVKMLQEAGVGCCFVGERDQKQK